jgi:hypothetical protein
VYLVLLNMPCRKAKQSLLTDGIQALQKQKKKGKKVNKAVIEERDKQVWQLICSSGSSYCAAAAADRSNRACWPGGYGSMS